MIKVKSLYCIIITLFFSIQLNAWGRNQNPNTVLIFNHIPPYVRSSFPIPKLEWKDDRPQITIFDNFYQYDFNPKSLISDTIIFCPRNEHIVLTFLYSMAREPLNYLINKGDTVTFSFVNGIPYAKTNESSKNNYLNYDYDRLIANKSIQQNTSYDIYKHPTLLFKDLNDINRVREFKKSYYSPARSFLNNELLFLYRFKELRDKSPAIFNFFQDKLTYQTAELDFDQHKLSADSLNTILALNKQMPVTSTYSYFLPFMEIISDSVIVRNAKILLYANGSEIDYRDVYERTSKWSVINDFYKKQLLYKYLKKIGEIFSAADLRTYLSRFSSFSEDTLLVKKIKNEFLISDDPGSLSKDSLFMTDAGNNKLSLQTLVNLNKGKIVYIDFWASWCIPCRREMKEAGKLRDAFNGKDVVFVYLSIDKSKNDWMKASAEEKLNEVQHNFILTNSDSSVFLKSIHFGTIPRYLLYDKYGNLVHKNAPAPSSLETQRLITDYLNK